jgi:serine/threonine protein kinase
VQVRRDIYIMRSLRHKHIVRMYEVPTSDTKLYFVMELVTCGELFERLEEYWRVDESLARHFFHQLVDGVDFCHKRGVSHRDLWLDNLLLDANGDIKITPFAFSSMLGNDVNFGLLYTQCITPDYCAPERIEGANEGYNGAKADVWSCGIIMYALLVGALPFQEQETDRLYDLILACDVHYPSLISLLAKDLLSRLIVRDPVKRLTLAETKRHEWFLVEFIGDDARLLKTPAFYNKGSTNGNNSGSRSSTPSASGRTTPKRYTYSAQYQDVEHPSGEPQGFHPQVRDIPQPPPHTHVQSQTQDEVQPSPDSSDHRHPSGPNACGHVDHSLVAGQQGAYCRDILLSPPARQVDESYL